MLSISTSNNCTGCQACYNVCPVNAITMTTDYNKLEGFLYPIINNDLCISCKKCESVCPIIHKPQNESNYNQTCFACYNTNENIRLESSSGGIFTLLAERILENNGVVFGAKFDNKFNVIHDYTENMNDLSSFRGSKYVQTNIKDSYKKCKEFLELGREVLFSGTPCQIGGLKSFLGKEYRNLILIDFICHGVPSPLLWKKYIAYREDIAKSKTKRISFRNKNCGWKRFSVLFSYENNTEYLTYFDKDSYMQFFLKDVCLRPSCYECNFKTINRVSDITIADFWGIQNEIPEIDDDKGISFVLIQSKQGQKRFSELDNIVKKQINIEQGMKHNPSLIKAVTKPKKRQSFFYDLENIAFEKNINKYSKDSFLFSCKKICYFFAKNILGESGIKTVKKILGK